MGSQVNNAASGSNKEFETAESSQEKEQDEEDEERDTRSCSRAIQQAS